MDLQSKAWTHRIMFTSLPYNYRPQRASLSFLILQTTANSQLLGTYAVVIWCGCMYVLLIAFACNLINTEKLSEARRRGTLTALLHIAACSSLEAYEKQQQHCFSFTIISMCLDQNFTLCSSPLIIWPHIAFVSDASTQVTVTVPVNAYFTLPSNYVKQ